MKSGFELSGSYSLRVRCRGNGYDNTATADAVAGARLPSRHV